LFSSIYSKNKKWIVFSKHWVKKTLRNANWIKQWQFSSSVIFKKHLIFHKINVAIFVSIVFKCKMYLIVRSNYWSRETYSLQTIRRLVINWRITVDKTFDRYEYDDHYFLTDPREFIYEFFPLQPEWQLLKNPITQRDFEDLPFVRSLFFRYGLYFPDSNTKAVMFTDATGKTYYY